MANLHTYPVLSRIRRDGKVYAPETDRDEIELPKAEAIRLAALGCIGSAQEVDLATRLQELIAAGHDVAALNMQDIGKLLGKDAKGVKRADVDDALDAIAKTADA